MQSKLFVLPSELSSRPDFEQFVLYLDRLLTKYADQIAFVVLFGSMARGNWSRGSDYDLLIGLDKDDGKRLIDRTMEFSADAERLALDVQPFVYCRSEWELMFQEAHPLLLEVLEHGMSLWDRGDYARLKSVFEQ
ncbi:MAG: nucleotidyltransferase domain-containing protein [Planctomycetes bacterium]|nr:nucleotidyltransferase domain-containing protein [Planctomycetota bacterium]